MWYEILPSFGVIAVALTVPTFATYVVNRIGYGKPCRRETLTLHTFNNFNERMYWRDRRLTGNAYKLQGLESIPEK